MSTARDIVAATDPTREATSTASEEKAIAGPAHRVQATMAAGAVEGISAAGPISAVRAGLEAATEPPVSEAATRGMERVAIRVSTPTLHSILRERPMGSPISARFTSAAVAAEVETTRTLEERPGTAGMAPASSSFMAIPLR
jgi:hypothetical protein